MESLQGNRDEQERSQGRENQRTLTWEFSAEIPAELLQASGIRQGRLVVAAIERPSWLDRINLLCASNLVDWLTGSLAKLLLLWCVWDCEKEVSLLLGGRHFGPPNSRGKKGIQTV